MAAWTREAGLPKPEILEIPGAVVVRFGRKAYLVPLSTKHDLTDRQRAILELLRGSQGGLALRQIHPEVGNDATERQVREDLATLKAWGLAISSGHGRGALWKCN